MKLRVLFVVILSAFVLQACGGKGGCSQEDLTAKAQEISEKMQAMATENPEKLMEISARWQEIANEVAGGDASDVCNAYDEFLAELN